MGKFAALSRIEVDSEIGRNAVAMMLQHSPLIRFLDENNAFELDAMDFDWYPADNAANIQARARGGAFTIQDVAPGSKETGLLYIMGDGVHIDEGDIADMDNKLRDIDTHLQKKLERRLRDFARDLDGYLFNGTGAGSPAQMKGLTAYFDGSTDIPGWPTGNKGVVNATDYLGDGDGVSFDLTTANNYDVFLEAMMAWLAIVGDPKGILMNRSLRARLTTIARKAHILGESRDSFGRPQQTFDGIPMVDMLDASVPIVEEDDTAGTPLLNTTSLWIASPGEMRGSLVTNSGLAFKDYDPDDKQSKGHTFETRLAWKFEEIDSFLRVRNIKIKAVPAV